MNKGNKQYQQLLQKMSKIEIKTTTIEDELGGNVKRSTTEG